MSAIQVTSWGTPEGLANDRSAPLHDCLWEIAQEQAVLERMKQTGESWDTAVSKVSQQDIRKHLDVVCDDNGFRRLDGSGTGGRNPNLIMEGERITVRIDPKQLHQPAPGITDGSAAAYSKAVAPADGSEGVDLKKKTELDTWLATIPGFPMLSDGTKSALITAYGTPGMNRENLAKLGGSGEFASLDANQQQQLLSVYGTEGKSYATGEVDKIVAMPDSCPSNNRLKLVGSAGFFQMDEGAQRQVLDRYTNDVHFRGAIDQIVGQPNFTNKNSVEQSHALEILARYAGRDGEGYGQVPEDKRMLVLVGLYDEVLSKPEFNLNQKDTGAQRDALDRFANDRAAEIAGTKLEPVDPNLANDID